MDRHTYLRIVKIDKLIRELRYPNLDRLRRELGAYSVRTLARDIEALKDSLNAPLKYSRKYGGYYYADKNFHLTQAQANLTSDELAALLLGYDHIKDVVAGSLKQYLTAAIDKIKLLTPSQISVDARLQRHTVSFGSMPVNHLSKAQASIFGKLAEAITRPRQVELVYQRLHDRRSTVRTVEPVHLRYAFGGWYLVAYCHRHKELRLFFVKNISRAGILKKPAIHKQPFNPAEYFKHSWGVFVGAPQELRLLFDSAAAYYVGDRTWHPSQKLIPRQDGALEMTLTVSSLEEITRWILGFGPGVRVLHPEKLRQDLKNLLKLMARKL